MLGAFCQCGSECLGNEGLSLSLSLRTSGTPCSLGLLFTKWVDVVPLFKSVLKESARMSELGLLT